ncbi:MAG: hypothetical protein R3A80_06460 [Bdellovibrionota bacterium]
MGKIVQILFLVLSSPYLGAGEINFAGIFDSFSGNQISKQRELEQRLENDINSFQSVRSSRVIVPVSETSRVEGLWGQTEARVLPVDVILKLRKRRRLSEDEYKGIYNLISSSLANRNQVIQANIRDEEGFEWSSENKQAKSFFKAASLEHEIWDRLKGPLAKEITWTGVHVSDADASCKITGKYLNKDSATNLEIRRDVMSVLGDLCSSARLSISRKRFAKAGVEWFAWLERAAYVLFGFALWGLAFSVIKMRGLKKLSSFEAGNQDGDDAIILTQMVERSPDQAAKWMVKAMLSEKSSKTEENANPQIFDQSP